ncbi:hypothetical protein ABFA07_001558 [Porites harrisoni]
MKPAGILEFSDLFFFWTALLTGCQASKNEQALLKKIFHPNYNLNERPAVNDSDAVTVILGLTLNQIVDVDEKNQILTTSAWVRQIWFNPLLAWNSSEFGGLKTINVSPKKVWLPDIVLYENADEDISFGGNLDRLNFRVVLHHTGKNVWLAPVTFKSKCRIDIKYFPFDTQYCKMKFGSWTYDGYRLDILNESHSADLGNYIESAEWDLVGVPSVRNVLKYFCCEEPFPDVTFTLIIRRRSLFYMMNLILPLVIITVLINVSFILPAESGERISLTITILLAMTVFMLVVAETIPPSSDVVPLIAKFYMAGMVEMAVGLVWTCYILKYYHSDVIEMPYWVRKYVLGYLGNFFGISMENLKRIQEHSKMRKDTGRKATLETSLEPIRNGSIKLKNKIRLINGHSNSPYDSHYRNTASSTNGFLAAPSLSASELSLNHIEGFQDPVLQLGERILDRVDTLVENSVVDDRLNNHKEEWRIAAMVMDKLSLWVFGIAVLVTVLAVFLQAPAYVA